MTCRKLIFKNSFKVPSMTSILNTKRNPKVLSKSFSKSTKSKANLQDLTLARSSISGSKTILEASTIAS